MKCKSILLFFILNVVTLISEAQTVPLYPGEIPNSKPTPNNEFGEDMVGYYVLHKISKPTIEVFLPKKEIAQGTAVIICPGGGYRVNAYQHEGIQVAQMLNEVGISAFVLKYRIPDTATMSRRDIGPLQDIQQAIKVVRANAIEWGINRDKVGILGFSAGGHLAASAGTFYNNNLLEDNPSTNLKPDFLILAYPVISFQENITHLGSRNQLLGENPSIEMVDKYSTELQVTADAPPTFIMHCTDDEAVKVQNSLLFYEALSAHQVPVEMHIYQNGGHGFGLNNPTTTDYWFDRCQNWMKNNHFIK